ncbi:MAG: cation transporter, partial [Phycisphaerae bacterium]|nr:cation transporter [Phycisphaerae bacterium]
MPTTTTIIRVDQLDCAGEEQVLRKAVGGIPGVSGVECNVVTRRMTVMHDAAAATPEQLAAKVRSVGMTPTVVSPAGETGAGAGADCGGAACAPGDEHAAAKEDTRPWWIKYGP